MWNIFAFIFHANIRPRLLVLRLVEAVSETTLPTVVTVKVTCHEDTGAALVSWTLAPQPVDFTILVHLDRERESTTY